VRRHEAVSEAVPQLTFTDSRREISSWRCADCSATARASASSIDGCCASGTWSSRRGEAGAGQSRSGIRLGRWSLCEAVLGIARPRCWYRGSLRDGRKLGLAIESGRRESKESRAVDCAICSLAGMTQCGPRWPMDNWGSGTAVGEVIPDAPRSAAESELTNVIDNLPKKEWYSAKELCAKCPTP